MHAASWRLQRPTAVPGVLPNQIEQALLSRHGNAPGTMAPGMRVYAQCDPMADAIAFPKLQARDRFIHMPEARHQVDEVLAGVRRRAQRRNRMPKTPP